MVRVCKLLWYLQMVAPWAKYRIHYYDFMMTTDSGWDGPRFQIQGAWATITSELQLREEFEQKRITTETL